jgi:FtsH-binding integral membrane protein
MFIIGFICNLVGLIGGLVAIHQLVNKDRKLAVYFIYIALFIAMFGSVLISYD